MGWIARSVHAGPLYRGAGVQDNLSEPHDSGRGSPMAERSGQLELIRRLSEGA